MLALSIKLTMCIPCEPAIPLSINANACAPEIGTRKVGELMPNNLTLKISEVFIKEKKMVSKLLWYIPNVKYSKSMKMIKLLLLAI